MPQDIQANNKRIAKNTLFLYVRMLVMMLIGLFTSRVILNALGVSDLGVMNVAGGVVGMFTFLNGTMALGTQRFLTYEIGTDNKEKLLRVFKTAMTLHFILAAIIVVLCETVGLWYMYNKLNVPPERFVAALWCFHLSVLGCGVSIIQVPFSASLVAHERMDIFAYMTIYDAATKLLSAYLITLVPFDRVILYSTLTLVFSLTSIYIYNWYCRKHFEECGFHFGIDKELLRNMASFSGWSTVGYLAAMGQSTGVNLLINFFCGTVVNGARGLAFQASGWVTKFVTGFQTAMNPQITKYYASGDIENMSKLVIRGAQLSSYLLLFLGIPLFVEIEWVIKLWLGQCPEYVPIFLRLVLIETLFRTLGNPTTIAIHATGRMKWVNITVGGILLLIVPMGYLLFKLGCSVEVVVAANIIPWVIVPFVRIHWVNKYSKHQFAVKEYCLAFAKVTVLAIIMTLPPVCLKNLMTNDDVLTFVAVGFASVIVSSTIIYFLGFDRNMKLMFHKQVQQAYSRIKAVFDR